MFLNALTAVMSAILSVFLSVQKKIILSM